MNDFQLGLTLLGILFVLVVWGVNKLQERRLCKKIEKKFAGQQSDILFHANAQKINQRAQSSEAPSIQEPPIQERLEPHFSEPEPSARSIVIDEEIHACIYLSADHPLHGALLLAQWQALRPNISQAISLVGAQGHEHWSPIQAEQNYENILFAIQLASRSGALNEIEYSAFVAVVEQIAQQLDATCDAPEMAETILRAQALDARCVTLDAQIGINLVRPQGTWSGAVIAQLAQQQGLILRNGYFDAIGAAGEKLFCLQNGDGAALFHPDQSTSVDTARLTLLLDVPCTPATPQAFQRMTQTAQSLAESLAALLVDDHLQTLTPASLTLIQRQIELVHTRMQEQGITPGSQRALALFR